MRLMGRMVLVLGAICLVAAAGLSGVYSLTKEPIAQAERQEKIDAISQVLPAGAPLTNDPLADVIYLGDSGRKVQRELPAGADAEALPAGWTRLHVCRRGDELAGLAMEVGSNAGYAGEIRLIVGLDLQGEVLGVRVLKHSETPGLGAKITEQRFLDRLTWVDPQGKSERWSVDNLDGLKVKKDGGKVDAISGATISPRAACAALSQGLKLYGAALPELRLLLAPEPEPEPEPALSAPRNVADALQAFYRTHSAPAADAQQQEGAQ